MDPVITAQVSKREGIGWELGLQIGMNSPGLEHAEHDAREPVSDRTSDPLQNARCTCMKAKHDPGPSFASELSTKCW
jgi:hypothetical protein